MVSLQIVKEYRRKFFHLFGLIYVVLYAHVPKLACFQIMSGLGMLIVMMEWFRLRNADFNGWLWARVGQVARDWEKNNISGLFWTWLGSFLTMVLYPQRDVVLGAIMFMIFGDAAAALVGRLWGRHPWPDRPGKTIEGMIAFAVAAALAGFCFLPLRVTIPAAILVASFESCRLPVDDNLWIPIVSGLCLTLAKAI